MTPHRDPAQLIPTQPANMPTEFSIFTHSVGAHAAHHTLPDKLRAIAAAGFSSVEIFQDDLDAFAASAAFGEEHALLTPPESPQAEIKGLHGITTAAAATFNAHGVCSSATLRREINAACYIGKLCAQLGLRVLNLQPIRDVEGWLDPEARELAFHRVRSRFPILRAVGTNLLLCCSSNVGAPSTTGSGEVIAQDLGQLADEAAAYGTQTGTGALRLGFEALSWGAHIDVWRQAWEVVDLAQRDNLGLVLDSFNTLAREWADPCQASGIASPDPTPALQQSLQAIAKLPPHKVFLVQIGDARRPLGGPLPTSPNADEPRPARMVWSRANRLFPGDVERGAYLPVVEFMRAVIKTGYTGAWSIEVFNSSLSEEGEHVPREHAERAIRGLRWLRSVLQ